MKEKFEKVLETVIVFLFLSIIVCVSLQVVFRYFLHDPLVWTEETAKLATIWMVFLGLALAEKDGCHISVDFLVIRMPTGLQRFVRIAIELFDIAVLLAVSYFALDFIAIQKVMRNPALDISLMYFSAAIPIGCLLYSIYKMFTIGRIWNARDFSEFSGLPCAETAQATE